MTYLLVILSVILIFSLIINYVVIRKNLELSDQREELVDQIEISLDILDDCYRRISHHAETPVMMDEPIVREVVNDLKFAKNAILAIASNVVTYGYNESEHDDDDDEEGDDR